jgi:hypothetical protein
MTRSGVSSTIDPKRLFVESVPVAEILFLWSLVAVLAEAMVRGYRAAGTAALGLRVAGIVMAFVYVAARADALAGSRPWTDWPGTGSGQIRENWRVLLAAAPWVLAAVATRFLPPLTQFGVPPLYRTILDPVAFALTGAAAAPAVLYAVAFGLAWVRQEWRPRDDTGDADRSSDGSGATADD